MPVNQPQSAMLLRPDATEAKCFRVHHRDFFGVCEEHGIVHVRVAVQLIAAHAPSRGEAPVKVQSWTRPPPGESSIYPGWSAQHASNSGSLAPMCRASK